MTTTTYATKITHKYLMGKTKRELADEYLILCDTLDKERSLTERLRQDLVQPKGYSAALFGRAPVGFAPYGLKDLCDVCGSPEWTHPTSDHKFAPMKSSAESAPQSVAEPGPTGEYEAKRADMAAEIAKLRAVLDKCWEDNDARLLAEIDRLRAANEKCEQEVQQAKIEAERRRSELVVMTTERLLPLEQEVRRLKAINKELADWWNATNPWRDDDIEASKAVNSD